MFKNMFNNKPIVDLKTYLPKIGVWVSTVAWNMEIGVGRYAETMVFRGNKEGITDWRYMYFESHGYTTDKEILTKEHNRIVEGIKNNTITLDRMDEYGKT